MQDRSVTVGNPRYGFYEGTLFLTHIRVIRQSRNIESLVEGDRDGDVKKWLAEVGGTKEDNLRWMSFPDVDKFYFTAERDHVETILTAPIPFTGSDPTGSGGC